MFVRVLVPNLFGRVGDMLSQLGRRFGDAIIICPTMVETVEVDGQTLLVADTLPRRKDVHVLLPQRVPVLKTIPAMSPKHIERLVLLVPFGSGESGVCAMRVAVKVAKQLRIYRHLGVELLLYHTTWRKPDVESEDGLDHLDIDARAIATTLQRIAVGNELNFRYQIDIGAPTVPDGIIACALHNNAALIVMARGNEVRLGSYVTQMMDLSPAPLLIARTEG